MKHHWLNVEVDPWNEVHECRAPGGCGLRSVTLISGSGKYLTYRSPFRSAFGGPDRMDVLAPETCEESVALLAAMEVIGS